MRRWARRAAAVLAAGALAAPPAAASGARVDAVGLTDYVRDEQADMDLNPAFATAIAGNRLFLGMDGELRRSIAKNFTSHTKTVNKDIDWNGEFVNAGPDWTWAVRWTPSLLRFRQDVKTYTGGVQTGYDFLQHKNLITGRGRVLLARSWGQTHAGVSLEAIPSNFETTSVSSRSRNESRTYQLDAGWIKGEHGGRQLALTATAVTSDLTVEDTFLYAGEAQQDTSTVQLRAVPQKPVGRSGFLRGQFEVAFNRSLLRYPSTYTVDSEKTVRVMPQAGVGFEAAMDGGFRWTAAADLSGTAHQKVTRDFRAAGPDDVTKFRSWFGTARVGLEKELTPTLAFRGRADVLQWTHSRRRESDGDFEDRETLTGPVQSVALGLGWDPKESMTVDFVFVADDVQRSSTVGLTGGAFPTDNHAWNLEVDVAATVRFGGRKDAAKSGRRSGRDR